MLQMLSGEEEGALEVFPKPKLINLFFFTFCQQLGIFKQILFFHCLITVSFPY